MEMFGVVMKGSPRRSAMLIAGSIDCSKGEIRLVAVVGKEKELEIEIEEFVARNREGIRCVLWMESTSGTELTGRDIAYGGHPIQRVGCLYVSSESSTRRETVLRWVDNCQLTSYSPTLVMREGSLSLRSRSRIAFV
jgi:hypothetical protein